MTFIPAFFESQSHWPRVPPPPVLGQSGGEARAAGVTPRGNPTISPHTGTIGHHPRFSNPPIHLQLRQRGGENGDSPGRNRPARCGNPSPTGRSLTCWGSYIEPPHPEEDTFPSPNEQILLKRCNSDNLGTKSVIPRVENDQNGVETPFPVADR